MREEEIVPRADPVIWGDRRGPLANEDLDAFEEHGVLCVRPFARRETEVLRAEAERLAAEAERDQDEVVIEPGSDAVRSIFRVHRSSDIFRELAKDARIADVARQIVGSDVTVHQSRLNYKPGFDGREFQWHSDFETWHMEDGMPRMRAVSVSIALTENHPSNGPLMVIPGSHRRYVRCAGETPEDHFRQSLRKQEFGVPSRDAIRALCDEAGRIEVCVGPPGSATFFDCNAMHGSAGSLSPWPRTNLFLVYNSVENRLRKPFGGRPPRPAFLAARRVRRVSRL